MTLTPLGDSAVVVVLGSGSDEFAVRQTVRLAELLECDRPMGVVDVVPAFATVTVFYDASQISGYERLCAEIAVRAQRLDREEIGRETRVMEIPVCYGGEGGADLAEVAAHAGLSPDAVVALHTGGDYFVQAIGFAPGFAYLGGLSARIHAPRRKTPRTAVPAGTVGIGGAQTGVYPLVTPGGWNLIGRTPLRLFDGAKKEPALLRAGDRVRFRAINAEEFALWR